MSSSLCQHCGLPLRGGAAFGLCPHCLLQLAQPPAPPPSTSGPDGTPHEFPGARIGRYQLIEPLGEGGFGTVWLAEQQEPVRRQVALKIVKLGMDTREVVARFEAERQALAMMDHPNIARVFDGGATDHGRPYFVMELVRGQRITAYCDAHRLDARERLRLFLDVCLAVQHAHQKGIIHRDLKPSNVLVTEQDGRPLAKVIDFGIAKATDPQIGFDPFFTRFGQILGTPAYMSPEQAGLDGLDLDTRSDLYSLGVLLYELLTGRTPFENVDPRAAGLEQVLRTIREVEPVTPSNRLASLPPAERQTSALNRSLPAHRLARLLRGELDWIVMKCLEKDRRRRYQGAGDLAEDIGRFLRGEAVSAVGPQLGYRAAKFVRRHRVFLAATGAVIITLLAGVIATTRQAARATLAASGEREARRHAEAGWQAVRRNLYSADMNLAAEAIRINSLGQAREFLDRHRPQPGESDLRHWEWSWLLSQTRDRSDFAVPSAGAVFNRLGIDPAGRTLAIPMGRGGKVQLWDIPTRAPRGELDTPSYQTFFSPGSRWIASVVSQQGRVDVFDAVTGAAVARIPRETQVYDVAFSPDESLLAITSDAHTATSRVKLQLWQWSKAALIAERTFPSFQDSFHYKLAFHPDGRRLAITEREGEVRLLNTTNLADVQVLEVYDRGAGAVAISPDGRWIAAGVVGRELSVYVWDLHTNRPPVILRLHPVGVASLAFSPDSRRLAGGASDQTVKLWSLPALQPEAVLRGHASDLRSVGFLGQGDWLASASSGAEIKLWNLKAMRSDTNDWILPSLKSPRLSADFSRFAGIGPARTVVAGTTFHETPPPPLPDLGTAIGLTALSPDGNAVVSLDDDNRLRLQAAPGARVLQQDRPSGARIARMGFIRGGEFLVTLDEAGLIRRWNRELQPVAEFQLPRGFTLIPGALMIEGDRLVCATLEGRKVVSLMDGATVATLETAPGTLLTHVFSTDGRLLVTGNDRGEVEFYETETWARQGRPLRCQSDAIWLIALSPDGRRLATSGFQRDPPRLWDVPSRQQVCVLPGFAAGVTFLRFSADGRSLALTNPEGRVRILRAD